ncbi:MAG: hypothetical protein H6573_26015 [Lewinellaceae bacterium]|nr:hypothetical protein [Lewinellaceae bacterium]
MSQIKRNSFFWASYTDLMTSLFFVMLVLYVLTFVLLKRQKDKVQLAADRYEEIQRVEKGVRELENTDYFEYQEQYKRLILTKEVNFPRNKSEIPRDAETYLTKVGEEVRDVIAKNEQESDSTKVRYLVIIEGMASKDPKVKNLTDYNYELSFQRAYSLYKFWKEERINFSLENTEFIIAGSGTGGVGRNEVDEKLNQRFLIQIIPKIRAR